MSISGDHCSLLSSTCRRRIRPISKPHRQQHYRPYQNTVAPPAAGAPTQMAIPTITSKPSIPQKYRTRRLKKCFVRITKRCAKRSYRPDLAASGSSQSLTKILGVSFFPIVWNPARSGRFGDPQSPDLFTNRIGLYSLLTIGTLTWMSSVGRGQSREVSCC